MENTNFHGRSCSLIFRSRVGSLVSKKIPPPGSPPVLLSQRFSPHSTPTVKISIRKILVSVKFLSAILGPERGASILWTPGQKCVLAAGKTMSIKFLVLGGGGYFGFGGGQCRFYFYGRADFSDGSGKMILKMLCRMRAAVRIHVPHDTASENGS